VTAPSASVAERTARILGAAALRWQPVQGGYTPAARWRVELGTSRAFVKAATTPLTARMLRAELRAYSAVRGAFMPTFFGGDDDGETPLIVVEDLGSARWPPPWDAPLVDAVLAALDEVHSQRPEPMIDQGAMTVEPGWTLVAADPEPFLHLRVASAAWLDRSLDQLLAGEAACRTTGEALLHFDVRSDNLCLTPQGVKLIDWAEARSGNPDLDLGFWLPSLAAEGGPLPEAILPSSPEIAAWVSGYFAARAGLPDIADAPHVRQVQRVQLATALPWAARALGLQPP